MGLYIKGLEMPASGELLVIIAPNGEVQFKKSVASTWDKTTAVPVPPHGRLIDEEALAQDAYRRMLECAKYERPDEKPYEVLRAIELAPTVIPAEEGKI